MRIENDIKLDYSDVLIRPKRSTMVSRSQVDLNRKYTFRNYVSDHEHVHYYGTPIMAANMDGVGTFGMAIELSKMGMFTCLVKTYSVEDLVHFFNRDDYDITSNVAMSIGTSDNDIKKFFDVYEQTGKRLKYLCVDVANGYTEHFVDKIRKIRNYCKEVVIIAGNVVTGETTEELILRGADIVKVGIGPGCFTPDTEVLKSDGWEFINNVKVGDKVLTHNGTWENVTRQWNFNHHKEISNVELDNGDVYRMTPDHKVFAVHSSKQNKCKTQRDIISNGEWVEAKNLNEEWFVVTQ